MSKSPTKRIYWNPAEPKLARAVNHARMFLTMTHDFIHGKPDADLSYWLTDPGEPIPPPVSKNYEAMLALYNEYAVRRHDEGAAGIAPPTPNYEQLLLGAARGDSTSANKLIEAAIDCLVDCREMPAPVRVFTVLRLLACARTARKGRGAERKTFRDGFITGAVRAVSELGFHPTRSKMPGPKGHKTESACSIVAKVLAESGLNLSEHAINEIWRRSKYKNVPK